MKIERILSCGAAIAMALGLAASAKASIVTATFQGVVTSGYDQTGLFGTPNANLTGDSFTAVYTVNDRVKAASSYLPGFGSFIQGGPSIYGSQSPVSASITINGITFGINNDAHNMGEVSQYNNIVNGNNLPWAPLSQMIYYDANIYDDVINNNYDIVSEAILTDYIQLQQNLLSSDYHTPISYILQPYDRTFENFEDIVCGFDGTSDETCPIWTVAKLETTSVAITGDPGNEFWPVWPPVPEPATWTMLILGVGMIGFTVRRRSANVVPTT